VNGLIQAALVLVLTSLSGMAFAESGSRAEPGPSNGLAQQSKDSISKPVQMIRTLQLMQDQIANGSTEAHLGQRGLLSILDNRFMELEQGVWLESKNVRAAIAFVLSGGNPQILRRLLEMSQPALPLEHRSFVEGTLAYVEGREEEAKSKLLSIDLPSLPPMLSAQLALVQSALLVRTDAQKSSDLLDYVRLQAPGTLLEEGALRRQVFVASQTGDVKRFIALSSAYLRRYRQSVYAGNFRQRLASALTRIDFGKDQSLFNGVVEMLADLELEARRELYLLAARSSINQGLTRSAHMLADKARELSADDAASANKARLYRAAAMVVSPETIEAAVGELENIDKSALSESDVVLLNSALSMAEQIRTMPDGKVAGTQKSSVPPVLRNGTAIAAASEAEQAPEQLQALSKARNALSQIDKLIKNQASIVQ
jgi:chemotaxis protein MotC